MARGRVRGWMRWLRRLVRWRDGIELDGLMRCDVIRFLQGPAGCLLSISVLGGVTLDWFGLG